MRLSCAFLAALLAAAEGSSGQEGTPPSEYEVKAALILNIAKFIEWPEGSFEDDKSPLVIGVLGKDPFGEILEKTFDKRKLNDRDIRIRRAARLQDLGGCHLVFVSTSERDRLGPILEELSKIKVLAVGEGPRFASAGGVVGLVLDEKKVRFEINPDAADRAGIKISSKLLKLARIVKDGK